MGIAICIAAHGSSVPRPHTSHGAAGMSGAQCTEAALHVELQRAVATVVRARGETRGQPGLTKGDAQRLPELRRSMAVVDQL
eukprot:CAMPEP_0168460896 /NCGR_PEP_ID=MMETSP0228-20121227/53683_1 /TAXON_ID=133427 /ORGANISM="Protoceratium reticulatum, Strain CCCM 535 (=CCMP 1889)" /LENGTH=81 /DNA_ID=CAMNT_0008476149 /DNA_START=577 /DNA_END=818 /DNA_ORIENTATION=+